MRWSHPLKWRRSESSTRGASWPVAVRMVPCIEAIGELGSLPEDVHMSHPAPGLNVIGHNCQFLCRSLVVGMVTFALFCRFLSAIAVALFLDPDLCILLLALLFLLFLLQLLGPTRYFLCLARWLFLTTA